MNRLSAIRPVLLVVAPFLLALGLVLPLVRLEKLWFSDETLSLLGTVASLWNGGDLVLAVLVAIVSIVLPDLTMIGIAAEFMAARRHWQPVLSQRRAASVQVVLMDVLLVAIVIAAAKARGLANAFSQSGLWRYAASAMISGLLHSLMGNVSGPK